MTQALYAHMNNKRKKIKKKKKYLLSSPKNTSGGKSSGSYSGSSQILGFKVCLKPRVVTQAWP
jgi:hypothetical protein